MEVPTAVGWLHETISQGNMKWDITQVTKHGNSEIYEIMCRMEKRFPTHSLDIVAEWLLSGHQLTSHLLFGTISFPRTGLLIT